MSARTHKLRADSKDELYDSYVEFCSQPGNANCAKDPDPTDKEAVLAAMDYDKPYDAYELNCRFS